LQGRRAGVVTRVAAAAIDLAVILVGLAAGYAAVAGVVFVLNPRSFSWPTGLGWSLPVAVVVLATPYLAVCWSACGRTVGDLFLGLRVCVRDGQLLHPGRAVVRALGYLIFPAGLFWVPFDASRRSLQDVLFATMVVYDWEARG